MGRAVAADNAVMEVEPTKAEPPKRKRRWFRFSLRTLLILTAIGGVACGLLGKKIEQKRKERELVSAIRTLGGSVNFDYQRTENSRPAWIDREAFGAAWLRAILGDNFFSDIEFVGFAPRPQSKDEAVDNVFEGLQRLPHLQFLYLAGNKINDDRLMTLGVLTQLQGLELHKTQVSDAAIERLTRSLPNCKIQH